MLGGLAGVPELFRALMRVRRRRRRSRRSGWRPASGPGESAASIASAGRRARARSPADPVVVRAVCAVAGRRAGPRRAGARPAARRAGAERGAALDPRRVLRALPIRSRRPTRWAPYPRRRHRAGRVRAHARSSVPTTFHDGRALNLDTWRGRSSRSPRLAPDGDLGASTFLDRAGRATLDRRRPRDDRRHPPLRQRPARDRRRVDRVRARASRAR